MMTNCDICGRKVTFRKYRDFIQHIRVSSKGMEEKISGYEVDLCDACREKVQKPLKEFYISLCASKDFIKLNFVETYDDDCYTTNERQLDTRIDCIPERREAA
jgi:hypothetical protein